MLGVWYTLSATERSQIFGSVSEVLSTKRDGGVGWGGGGGGGGDKRERAQ